MPTAEAIRILNSVRQTTAPSGLTPRQAKLYSQRLRRGMGREGLVTFAPADVYTNLDEALLLLDSALLERSQPEAWQRSVKRGGEILEWLSQPELRPEGAPLHLLSAAAYQVAGYPALALGELRHVPEDETTSSILVRLLRADFPATMSALQQFWNDEVRRPTDESGDLAALTSKHVVMCIGTVVDYFRTGNGELVVRALDKLEALASSYLQSTDPYSYLLARLTAQACRNYVSSSLWPHITALQSVSGEQAGNALVQFARSAFINRRALVWPAQSAGITRLRDNNSFVLCTPTGSGKTTVATIAVVQGLFAPSPALPPGLEGLETSNLVLYLVPSRALAAEVEARLSEDLRGIAAQPTIITGLYGGIDWGPTDAWIQSDLPTVVVCTFEKADALIRYLGVLFLDRVRLVVIDEAHMVEHPRPVGLHDGSSRAYRLEQLGARLLRARDNYDFRLIALSAVASRAAPALARWVTGQADAQPTSSNYRSTRQMLGHLEVSSSGHFIIRYDLMDGRPLRFDDERPQETPYVREPFPSIPGGRPEGGPEVSMRAPTLWAALQLAAERPDGSKSSVLISLTQNVDAFASTAADLLDEWPTDTLPRYRDQHTDDESWNRCLAAAADYFSVESVEYRLLSRGIAVHHGKMPGLMARRLKVLIDSGRVRVIIATSTLSEGVNIPVNYILMPSVCRATSPLSLQEFTNVIGRAGRPGVATEGHALVVLPQREITRGRRGPAPSRQWDAYQSLVADIERTVAATATGDGQDNATSALRQLLEAIEAAWRGLAPNGTQQEFIFWLEQTAIPSTGDLSDAEKYLDSLDGFLIAAIHEVEELARRELTREETEAELQRLWRHTYAFASRFEEARLANIWLSRGRTTKERYPDAARRRQIYRTSLSPRSATSLIEHVNVIRNKLLEGSEYAVWPTEQKLTFVSEVIGLLSGVPAFAIGTSLGRQRQFSDWPRILRWWLAKSTLVPQPRPNAITRWYEFVAQNFLYRSTWGLGSVLGLLLDLAEGDQPIRPLEMDDWPRSGLPWIAFWLKELITWGTLDPVAAFLLARGNAIDRPQAEVEAQAYYSNLGIDLTANDRLDPRAIRDWAIGRSVGTSTISETSSIDIPSALARAPETYLRPVFTVVPLDQTDQITWVDPAGYVVAHSERPPGWPETSDDFLFELDVQTSLVKGERYRAHL